MSELTKNYIEELAKGGKDLSTSEKWTNYLDFLGRFHSYSVNNTISIHLQRPDATLVASFSDWARHGRYVKKGEKGIRIIAPHTYKAEDPSTGKETIQLGFHLAHCFDISQTYECDLPESPCRIPGAEIADYGPLRKALAAISPVPIEYRSIKDSANSCYKPDECCIIVKDGLPELQAIKTTIYEIAHACLLSISAKEEKTDQHTHKIQAESVAYAVRRYLNLDTTDYSFRYIAEWSKKQSPDELKSNIEAISKASDHIIKDLEELQQY